jgi:DNA gyrase subunit A
MIVSKLGMSIRFNENDAREMGRTATGVRGIKLRDDDFVVAMDSVSSGNQLLVVTEKGYGKRTELDQYPLQNRGGFGVKTLQLTDKTGGIVGARLVQEDHELMVSTKQGTLIRTSVDGISVIGRATQGVRVIRLADDDEVTAIARIEVEDVVEDEDLLDGEEGSADLPDSSEDPEDKEGDQADESDE